MIRWANAIWYYWGYAGADIMEIELKYENTTEYSKILRNFAIL